jgi:integrase
LKEPYLPADPKTIRAFIEDRVRAGKKPATVKRYVATIARVHIAAGLLNPCSSEAVRLGLKKMGRETSARQDQAHPFGWKDIKEFIDGAGEGLRADRERALLCVAYETLVRRSELVALELRDIEFWPNGTGHALIRRGKTDAEGQGRVAYLSRETVKWLKVWLERSGVTEGAVFRRLIGKAQIGGPLNPGSIAPIFKRVAQWLGMPERIVHRVSGHSTRVGATQDLAALDIDLAAITQAGGWKSTRMPLQYAEKINAARSGMAKAAAATGRDKRVPG